MLGPPARDFQATGLEHIHSCEAGRVAPDLSARPWLMKACGSGTRAERGGCRSPCSAVRSRNVGMIRRNEQDEGPAELL